MSLANRTLSRCDSSASPLSVEEITLLLNDIDHWNLATEGSTTRITKEYKFKNYLLAQEFANKVADLAELENHHPRVCIEWGKAKVCWWTHSINGLFINDFIMAARCDEI